MKFGRPLVELRKRCSDELPQLGLVVDDQSQLRVDGNTGGVCRGHAYKNHTRPSKMPVRRPSCLCGSTQ